MPSVVSGAGVAAALGPTQLPRDQFGDELNVQWGLTGPNEDEVTVLQAWDLQILQILAPDPPK